MTQNPASPDRPPARIPDRMPVLVLSGFLGAGKTTFLNALLTGPVLKNSMVLVNEFGDTGLDSLFLEEAASVGSGLMIRELTSGCLCCTLQGPLVTTLEDMLRARDNGRIPPFPQLVIETTGLADPAPILGAFARHPYLSLRYLVGGIITVVDGAQELETLDQTPEATAQIAIADVLAISKSDLVDAPSLARLSSALKARNPHAHIATTDELLAQTDWLDMLLVQASILPAMPDAPPEHEHHAHHPAHAHAHAFSMVLSTDRPLEPRTLTMIMDLIAMNLPGDVLRVKGIAWLAGVDGAPDQPWAVHAAGPLQHPARPIEAGMAARLAGRLSQIVVITRTDQRQRLAELFAACLRSNRVPARS